MGGGGKQTTRQTTYQYTTYDIDVPVSTSFQIDTASIAEAIKEFAESNKELKKLKSQEIATLASIFGQWAQKDLQAKMIQAQVESQVGIQNIEAIKKTVTSISLAGLATWALVKGSKK